MEKPGAVESVIIVSDPAELDAAAAALVRFCGDRRIVAFYGPMGAGKTTFIRSLCKILGVVENVSSPTFSIVNEYHTSEGEPVFHMDCYRLERPEEAITIGVEEYFITGSWCFVEWPEKILNLLPEGRVEVTIRVDAPTRSIVFSHA